MFSSTFDFNSCFISHWKHLAIALQSYRLVMNVGLVFKSGIGVCSHNVCSAKLQPPKNAASAACDKNLTWSWSCPRRRQNFKIEGWCCWRSRLPKKGNRIILIRRERVDRQHHITDKKKTIETLPLKLTSGSRVLSAHYVVSSPKKKFKLQKQTVGLGDCKPKERANDFWLSVELTKLRCSMIVVPLKIHCWPKKLSVLAKAAAAVSAAICLNAKD